MENKMKTKTTLELRTAPLADFARSFVLSLPPRHAWAVRVCNGLIALVALLLLAAVMTGCEDKVRSPVSGKVMTMPQAEMEMQNAEKAWAAAKEEEKRAAEKEAKRTIRDATREAKKVEQASAEQIETIQTAAEDKVEDRLDGLADFVTDGDTRISRWRDELDVEIETAIAKRTMVAQVINAVGGTVAQTVPGAGPAVGVLTGILALLGIGGPPAAYALRGRMEKKANAAWDEAKKDAEAERKREHDTWDQSQLQAKLDQTNAAVLALVAQIAGKPIPAPGVPAPTTTTPNTTGGAG
jgi:hypothetical protein